MNRPVQLSLMFAPFLIFFVGLGIVVQDMRHPVTLNDQCVITGTAGDAQKFKKGSAFIYRQSNDLLNDVSLRCDRLGTLMLNDAQLFITPVKSGQGAKVTRKQYQFLPDRWMVSVFTGS